VTHDQVEALTMGHRVAVMQRGRLHQIGTPTALYDNPADLFVATFIGSPRMNVVPGTILGSGDETRLSCLGTTVEGIPLPDTAPRGREVLVGIRPHDMHLPRDAQFEVQIRGVIDVCEHTGTEVFAWMRVDGDRIAAKLPKSRIPLPGDSINVAFSPTDIYLFDVETHASVLDRSRPLDPSRAIPNGGG
jgi:ABC-type sugar transport system ATPase subunit